MAKIRFLERRFVWPTMTALPPVLFLGLIVLAYLKNNWIQGTALLIALAPGPLAMLLLARCLDEPMTPRDDAAYASAMKVITAGAVGGSLSTLTILSKVPNADAGPGLILATLTAVTTWTFLVDVMVWAYDTGRPYNARGGPAHARTPDGPR